MRHIKRQNKLHQRHSHSHIYLKRKMEKHKNHSTTNEKPYKWMGKMKSRRIERRNERTYFTSSPLRNKKEPKIK